MTGLFNFNPIAPDGVPLRLEFAFVHDRQVYCVRSRSDLVGAHGWVQCGLWVTHLNDDTARSGLPVLEQEGWLVVQQERLHAVWARGWPEATQPVKGSR